MKRETRLKKRLREIAEEHHDIPETVQCKGCGREIDISGLKLWDKFICGRCMRNMKLTALMFKFRYTHAYTVRKRIYTLIACVLITSFSAVWGWRLVQLMGHPVPVHLLTTGVAVLASIYLIVAREITEEYRLIAAFMILLMAARRLPLYYFAKQWGHPRPLTVLTPGFIAASFGIYFFILVYRRRRTLPVL